MTSSRKTLRPLRARFDEVYDTRIVGGGFFESDDYYRNEKGRYWRSLELISSLDLPSPAKILEIGGGQIAVLRKSLFGDQCTVGDISHEFDLPLRKNGVELAIVNLFDPKTSQIEKKFDLVVIMEVIEHIPVPAHVIFDRLKPLLSEDALLFVTTPNLFRLRNVIRMFCGIEIFDRFTIPQPGKSLGHQLEYTANQLRWQLEEAGMEIEMLTHESMGYTGHSVRARAARRILAPLETIRPIWRSTLAAAARVRKSGVVP